MTTHKSLFINGNWQTGKGDVFSSINAETGETVWEGCAASDIDVANACTAAHKAFASWSATSLEERISKPRSFCKIIEGRRKELEKVVAIPRDHRGVLGDPHPAAH